MLNLFKIVPSVALVNSLEISGYVGGTVTLPSGAKSSWKLSRIDWSIFANSTWIATYQKNRTNTQRLPRYGDRLELNITSGKRKPIACTA